MSDEIKKQTVKTLRDDLNKSRAALHRALGSGDQAKLKIAHKNADEAYAAYAASVERAKARLALDE